MAEEKTAAELQAEERELAIKRGDIIEDGEPEVKADDDGPAEVPEGEGDGDGEAEAGDDTGESEPEPEQEASAPEGEGEDEGESPDEEGDDKPIMIPKARFDEAAKKAKDRLAAMQKKLEQAEAQHVKQATDADLDALEGEIDALEDKRDEYIMEGELEKAKAARQEIKAKRKQHQQQFALQQSQQTGNAAVEQIRYETKLALYESKYPAINPDSDSYDAAVEAEVGELKAAFELQGWGSAAALDKAISYVPALREPSAEVEEPAPDPEIKRNQRAHKARKAAASASKAQAPDASKAGRDSDKGGKGDGLPDVGKMTPDQFAKWADSDPAALAKLRGDTLTAEDAA